MTAEQDAQKHTSSKETDRNKAAVEEAKRRGREKDEKNVAQTLSEAAEPVESRTVFPSLSPLPVSSLLSL